jgi:quercetin dioxygenase-like cupin family protein
VTTTAPFCPPRREATLQTGRHLVLARTSAPLTFRMIFLVLDCRKPVKRVLVDLERRSSRNPRLKRRVDDGPNLNRQSISGPNVISHNHSSEMEKKEMSKRLRNGAIALSVAAIGVFAYGGSAQANPTPTPIAIEVLTPRAAFTDDVSLQAHLKLDGHGTEVIKSANASRVVTTKVTMQPGAQVPWHTHHGPVFVTIAEGEVTYVASEGCTSRRYPAGTAFVDPGHGHVHAAVNSANTVTKFVATFFEAPDGDAPITIPAEAPAGCSIPSS